MVGLCVVTARGSLQPAAQRPELDTRPAPWLAVDRPSLQKKAQPGGQRESFLPHSCPQP